MIILKTTSLTAVLSATSVSPLPIVCSFIEFADATYTPTPVVTATNGLTAVEIVGVPDTDYTRQVKFLTVLNVNALEATVTLKHGTTIILRVTLEPNYTLVYTDGRGFSVVDDDGATVTVTGAAGVAAHSLLDAAVHTDTATQTVSRGSIIYGNSTPKWDELVKGAANTVLRSDGTDVAYGKVVLTTDVSGVLPVANGGTAGTLPVSSGGTGATTLTDTGIVTSHGTGALTSTRVPNVDGISFPAVQVPSADSNTLDDYEEGTFTPVLGGLVSTSGQTYSTQSGRYVKVGALVMCQVYLQFSNKGTITGSLVVSGLPFASGAGSSYSAGAIGYMTNMAAGSVINPKHSIMCYIQASQTYVNMLAVNDYVVLNPTIMAGDDVNNTTQLIFTISYSVI